LIVTGIHSCLRLFVLLLGVTSYAHTVIPQLALAPSCPSPCCSAWRGQRTNSGKKNQLHCPQNKTKIPRLPNVSIARLLLLALCPRTVSDCIRLVIGLAARCLGPKCRRPADNDVVHCGAEYACRHAHPLDRLSPSVQQPSPNALRPLVAADKRLLDTSAGPAHRQGSLGLTGASDPVACLFCRPTDGRNWPTGRRCWLF